MFKTLLKGTFGTLFAHPVRLVKAVWIWVLLFGCWLFVVTPNFDVPTDVSFVVYCLLKAILGVALARLILQPKTRSYGMDEVNYFFLMTFLIFFPMAAFFSGLLLVLPYTMCPTCSPFNPTQFFGGAFAAAIGLYVIVRVAPATTSVVFGKQSLWQNIKKTWKITGQYRFSLAFATVLILIFSLLLGMLIFVAIIMPDVVRWSEKGMQQLPLHEVFQTVEIWFSSTDTVLTLFMLTFLSVVYREILQIEKKDDCLICAETDDKSEALPSGITEAPVKNTETDEKTESFSDNEK